jgi:ABC-type lipoprotein export system ATPase subunit
VLGLDINLRNGKVEADPYEHEAGVGHLLRRVQTDRRECLVQALSGGRRRRVVRVRVQQGEG